MAREEANREFANTSFLYGGNAGYIEELYSQYQDNPSSLSQDWQDYFAALKDNREDVVKNAEGASWKKKHWPVHANGEMISALDGDWSELEKEMSEKISAHAKKSGANISSDDLQK